MTRTRALRVEVGRRQNEIAAQERRKAFQEQQAEAERNRRRALQDVGGGIDVTNSPAPPSSDPPSARGWGGLGDAKEAKGRGGGGGGGLSARDVELDRKAAVLAHK